MWTIMYTYIISCFPYSCATLLCGPPRGLGGAPAEGPPPPPLSCAPGRHPPRDMGRYRLGSGHPLKDYTKLREDYTNA